MITINLLQTLLPKWRGPHRRRGPDADVEPCPKPLVPRAEHRGERQPHASLFACDVPRPDPAIEAEREVVRELAELHGAPAHRVEQEPQLRPQITLDAVAHQLREPPRHRSRLLARETGRLQELEPREELLLYAAG